MRRPLIAGNWKMHGSRAQAVELLGGMPGSIDDSKTEVVVCPSFVYLDVALSLLKGSSIAVGGQDCNPNLEGAFTGEVSAQMLFDLGCTFVILGHSERRTLYGETDQLIAGKYAAALQAGLRPILCVGETLEQRDTGQALAVVKRQLEAVFADNEFDLPSVNAASGIDVAEISVEHVLHRLTQALQLALEWQQRPDADRVVAQTRIEIPMDTFHVCDQVRRILRAHLIARHRHIQGVARRIYACNKCGGQ